MTAAARVPGTVKEKESGTEVPPTFSGEFSQVIFKKKEGRGMRGAPEAGKVKVRSWNENRDSARRRRGGKEKLQACVEVSNGKVPKTRGNKGDGEGNGRKLQRQSRREASQGGEWKKRQVGSS